MYLHSQFCQKKNDFLSMSLGKEKQNKKKNGFVRIGKISQLLDV